MRQAQVGMKATETDFSISLPASQVHTTVHYAHLEISPLVSLGNSAAQSDNNPRFSGIDSCHVAERAPLQTNLEDDGETMADPPGEANALYVCIAPWDSMNQRSIQVRYFNVSGYF
jgi:hypothetical protein